LKTSNLNLPAKRPAMGDHSMHSLEVGIAVERNVFLEIEELLDEIILRKLIAGLMQQFGVAIESGENGEAVKGTERGLFTGDRCSPPRFDIVLAQVPALVFGLWVVLGEGDVSGRWLDLGFHEKVALDGLDSLGLLLRLDGLGHFFDVALSSVEVLLVRVPVVDEIRVVFPGDCRAIGDLGAVSDRLGTFSNRLGAFSDRIGAFSPWSVGRSFAP
jgi:hypothetical protein